MVLCENVALMRIQGNKHVGTLSPTRTDRTRRLGKMCDWLGVDCLLLWLVMYCTKWSHFIAIHSTLSRQPHSFLQPPWLWISLYFFRTHPLLFYISAPVSDVCLLFPIDEQPNNIQSKFALTQSHIPSREWCLILFAATVMCIKSTFAHSATGVMGFCK